MIHIVFIIICNTYIYHIDIASPFPWPLAQNGATVVRGEPRRNHFHFAMAEKQYEKVAEAAMAELEGGMCWPVEWFKEDLLEAQCS